MKKSFSRGDRIGVSIQQIISTLLLREISDPRLTLVTVSSVEMSDDLRYANVYYTTSGGEKKMRDAEKGFVSASGFIRKALAKELDLRYMPQLRFYPDRSFDYGEKIERLLKEIN